MEQRSLFGWEFSGKDVPMERSDFFPFDLMDALDMNLEEDTEVINITIFLSS